MFRIRMAVGDILTAHHGAGENKIIKLKKKKWPENGDLPHASSFGPQSDNFVKENCK